MSEPRAPGPVGRTHLAAARGDGDSSRQTGRTVTGEGWEAELSSWGRARPRGPQEGTASALETCPSGPQLPPSMQDPRERPPKQSPAFPRSAGVLRMPALCDSGRSPLQDVGFEPQLREQRKRNP